MKSYHLKLLFLLCVFFCLILQVKAETKYIKLIDAVNIRTGPATTYERIALGQVGSTYSLKSEQIIPDEAKNGNCDAGWYEIDYDGTVAYVCSYYVNLYTEVVEDGATPTSDCERQMQDLGFPSSYWNGLCSLKEKYPNWTFKPIKTNLDWTTVVNKESSCGINLIQTSNSEYLDPSCSHTDGPFKAVSQKAVAFYMDPRNFLTEKYIFQFEYLKYDQDLENEYVSAVAKLYGSAAFYTYHTSLGTDFSSLVANAGKETDVSPIFLASRMYQELGSSTSLYNLYSGVYVKSSPTYGDDETNWDPNAWYGYYNFYNIGVSSKCNSAYGTTYCGLTYAKNNNWNSVYEAIKGGATFLSGGYINKGQYTTYLQKFNVVPTNINQLYVHQYMENIMAPSSESTITYNTYKKLELLDKAFAFYIPVYSGMGATIVNTSSGAQPDTPNNSEQSSTPSINAIPIETIITSAGYKNRGEYMYGINTESTIENIKSTIEAIGGQKSVLILNSKGEELTTGTIATGYTIKINNSAETKSYKVVIKGDVSGDGKINALDLLQVQKSILGTYTLEDSYLEAADTSQDGKVNALDLLQVQKNILGTYTISQ